MESALLKKILAGKRKEVEAERKKLPLALLKKKLIGGAKPLNFFGAVSERPFSLIAEIKKSSPTEGVIVKRFSPSRLARLYKDAGVAAISVLTEEKFFGGSPENILKAKMSGKPVLRKDFIFDEWQVYESRLIGADAVLLIAEILSKNLLRELFTLVGKLGMTPFVEIYDERDFGKIKGLRLPVVGINTRDLKTGKIDKKHAARLALKVRAKVLVCESGVKDRKDIDEMRVSGFNSFLVGTSILKSADKVKFIRSLTGRGNENLNPLMSPFAKGGKKRIFKCKKKLRV